MATYLLTWNPERFPWGDLADEARLLRRGGELTGRWSCGNSKGIAPGDRFFLLRQGRPPRGIVASGWVASAPYPDRHWDPARRTKGISALYVDIRFESLLEPEGDAPLGVAELTRGPLNSVHWRTQISGIRIPDDAAALLEELWKQHLARRDRSGRGHGPDAVHEEDRPAPPSRDEGELLQRITLNPEIFGGKPTLRGRRLAVEHVLGMLAAGDSPEAILRGYAWLEPEDIQACLVYARRIVANERIEPLRIEHS